MWQTTVLVSQLLNIECLAFVPAEMDVHHGQKFPAACGEMGPYMLLAWVEYEREYLQSSDLFRPTESRDSMLT
jgi:hypothetical protein